MEKSTEAALTHAILYEIDAVLSACEGHVTDMQRELHSRVSGLPAVTIELPTPLDDPVDEINASIERMHVYLDEEPARPFLNVQK